MSIWKEQKTGKGNAAKGTPTTKTNVVPPAWKNGKGAVRGDKGKAAKK